MEKQDTQIYSAVYGNDSKSLVLFITWLPAAISFAFLRMIRVMRVTRVLPNERNVFYNFLYVSLGLAGFLMTMIIVEVQYQFTKAGYARSTAVVFVLSFLPLRIVIREEYDLWTGKKLQGMMNGSTSRLGIVTSCEKSNEDEVSLPSSINGAPVVFFSFDLLQLPLGFKKRFKKDGLSCMRR